MLRAAVVHFPKEENVADRTQEPKEKVIGDLGKYRPKEHGPIAQEGDPIYKTRSPGIGDKNLRAQVVWKKK